MPTSPSAWLTDNRRAGNKYPGVRCAGGERHRRVSRLLRVLTADAESVLVDGRPRTWLRMTGYANGDRICFGDDAAVAGRLVASAATDRARLL